MPHLSQCCHNAAGLMPLFPVAVSLTSFEARSCFLPVYTGISKFGYFFRWVCFEAKLGDMIDTNADIRNKNYLLQIIKYGDIILSE